MTKSNSKITKAVAKSTELKNSDQHGDDDRARRLIYTKIFIFCLIIYTSICAAIFIGKNRYEDHAAVVTASALAISLVVRAFAKPQKRVLEGLKLLGDWIAVIFTLSTLMKPLANHPWMIIIFTIVLAILATKAFWRETKI